MRPPTWYAEVSAKVLWNNTTNNREKMGSISYSSIIETHIVEVFRQLSCSKTLVHVVLHSFKFYTIFFTQLQHGFFNLTITSDRSWVCPFSLH